MFELEDFGESEALDRFREIGLASPEIVSAWHQVESSAPYRNQEGVTTMRFISMVKFAEANAEPPPKAFLDAMDQLARRRCQGRLRDGQGRRLAADRHGARVRLSGGKVTVMDGPFTEAKEVIGGYAIFEVNSKAEMLEWTRRFMDLHRTHMPGWEGEAEVRQIAGPGEKLCDQAHEMQAAAV